MMAEPYVRYTVVDPQSLEPCVTGDWPTYAEALRERDQLALTYGKNFSLGIAGIDTQGDLHLLADTPSPPGKPQSQRNWTSKQLWCIGLGFGLVLAGMLIGMRHLVVPARAPTATEFCKQWTDFAGAAAQQRNQGVPLARVQQAAIALARRQGLPPEKQEAVIRAMQGIVEELYKQQVLDPSLARQTVEMACMTALADAVTAQPVVPPPEPAAPWYTITRFDTCEKEEDGKGGPAELIDAWRFLGHTPKMADVTEHGVVVQTTMTVNDSTMQLKFTWYRGLERCQKVLEKMKRAEEQQREQERQKYR
jgi:hypothetical protein